MLNQEVSPTEGEEIHEYNKEFKPFNTIVLPIDQSESSKYSMNFALKDVVTDKDQVILLHCRKNIADEFSFQAPFGISNEDLTKMEKALKEESYEILRNAVEKFKSKNIQVRAIAIKGEPRREIEKKVKELKPDMVIMGSRGMGVIKKMFLGSVSEHMVHHLKIPVMVVPLKPVQ